MAERERPRLAEVVGRLLEEDNGRVEEETRRECAMKECERGGITGGLGVGVLLDPWKAIVAGFSTVRAAELFGMVLAVGRSGVMEIFS